MFTSYMFKLCLVFTFIKRYCMPTEDANSTGHFVQSVLVLENAEPVEASIFSNFHGLLGYDYRTFYDSSMQNKYTDKKASRSTCLLPYTYDESWLVFDLHFSIPSMNEMYNSEAYQILIERTSCKSSWQRPDKKFNLITPIAYLRRYMYIIYTYIRYDYSSM